MNMDLTFIVQNISQQITSVVAVNNDSKFYSKWVYGEEFEIKFPIGSLISFDNYLSNLQVLKRHL
jgi:hypothetical protein